MCEANKPGSGRSSQAPEKSFKDAASPEPWRIVFFGSPAFSLPSLETLSRGPDQVVLVVAPPPAPSGRGRRLSPSPTAARAVELGLPLLEAKSARKPEVIEAIRAARPDLMVVVAFGGFLPPELLTMGPYPPLNVHPSLLPRHRGAAPVNWSLIQGDRETGVSIIFLEEAMDAGPILSRRAFPIKDPESAGVWEDRLARAGAEDLLKVIAQLKNHTAVARPQEHALSTTNPLLRKDDGRVDFGRPALELADLINGVDPWPGAQTSFQGYALKLFGAAEAVGSTAPGRPGEVMGLDAAGRLLVATGRGVLAVAELQPEGKKRMAAADFQRGYKPGHLGRI